MLNEFKRPMWNDGYSKEQPWLNYFNSYERMHCCFGDDDDGGDSDGGAGDDAASTSDGGTASAAGSAEESSDSYSDAMGYDSDAGAGDDAASTSDGGTSFSAQSAEESEASYDAAMNAGPGWGEPDGFNDKDATYNAQTNNFDFAVDTKSDNFLEDVATIGFDNFENPSDLDLDLATMNEMYNNPDAYGMGYNDFVDMGYFDKAEAADYAQSKAEAAALEASYKDKGKDVSISVAKDGTYSYTGKDAFSVGYSEMGKGAELLGRNFGIGSVVDGFNRAFGTTDEKAGISTVAGGEYYGGLREEDITSEQIEASRGGSDSSDGQSTSQQNEDDTFGEDETDEGVDDTDTDTETSTTESEEEEEAAPETAMEAYFRKLGIASPALTVSSTSPSYFQGYPSYLPPTGPAANAAYRRKLALRTPRYQEPSGPNPSIATLAAAYGISYTEAAKKFAFPSVPAMGGGGLRSLMEYK